MRLSLSLDQITNLSIDGHIDIKISGEMPDMNEAIFVDYRDVEIYGLVTKINSANGIISVRIEIVDAELKKEWLSCVRSLYEINLIEGKVLVITMLDKLSEGSKWGDIDILLNLIDCEKESLDLISTFLAYISKKDISDRVKGQTAFYKNVFLRTTKGSN
jgi:hypothetical protein